MGLSRTTSGMVLDVQDFATLSGWSVESGWAADATRPAYLAYPTGVVRLNPGATIGTDPDAGGVREWGELVDSDGTQLATYGAGDGSAANGGTPTANAPWRVLKRATADGGVTWGTPSLFATPNGSPAASDSSMGWWRDGATYVFNLLAATSQTEGIPGGNYANQVFTATTLAGPYTYQNSTPALGGSGAANEQCSLIADAEKLGTGGYAGWMSVRTAGTTGDQSWSLGKATSTDGVTWTYGGGRELTTTTNAIGRGRPENPQRLPAVGGMAAVMANSVNGAASATDGNDLYFTTAPAAGSAPDFTAAYRQRIQSVVWPLDGRGYAVGIPRLICRADISNRFLTDARGNLGFTWDDAPATFAGAANPGYHHGRRILQGTLEPCPSAAAFTPSSGAKHVRVAATHTDVVIEFALEINASSVGAAPSGAVGVVYRASSATAGDTFTGYLIQMNRKSGGSVTDWEVSFYKNSGGGYALVGGVAPTAFTMYPSENNSNLTLQRFKLVVSGNTHTFYANDFTTPLFTRTDSSSPVTSGVALGFRSEIAARVYHASARSADAVTLAGLPAGAAVVLRGAATTVAATGTADGSGNVTLSAGHFPLAGVTVNGTDYAPAGGVWGGDVFAFSAAVPALALTSRGVSVGSVAGAWSLTGRP